MLLSSYRNLIGSLPYLDQAFETRKVNWQREYNKYQFFKIFCDRAFLSDTLKLSRKDLFLVAERSFYEGLISTIFWGYPRNMRGNSFSTILQSVSTIENLFNGRRQLNADEFICLVKELNGTGIGLSTLTKLLYFFRFTVDGYKCLILDKRIIQVINGKTFSELLAIGKITEFNKSLKYLDYLKEMQNLANAQNYVSDQLELFLFLFGNNLKSDA